jgi:hypothetical protein
MKDQFIRKWSNWWITNPNSQKLNEAFERELNELFATFEHDLKSEIEQLEPVNDKNGH